MLSPFSGGNPWQLGALAKRLMQAGLVVVAPLHLCDKKKNHDHSTLTTWTNWEARPEHITAAIHARARSALWHVRTDKVDVYGMSAGGLTALTLASAMGGALEIIVTAGATRRFHRCAGF